MGTVAFKPQESSIKELLTFSTPFYRWDEWSSGNPTQLLRDRAGSSLGLSPQAVLLVLGLTADPGWHGNEAPSHLSISGHLLGANHLAPKCCSDRLIWQLKRY